MLAGHEGDAPGGRAGSLASGARGNEPAPHARVVVVRVRSGHSGLGDVVGPRRDAQRGPGPVPSRRDFDLVVDE